MSLPLTVTVVAVLASAGVIDLGLPSDPNREFVEAALESARDSMKDPTSVKFKDLEASAKANCVRGEILAKNSMGAYTGYHSFIWIGGQTYIDPGKIELDPIISNLDEWSAYSTASHNCGMALGDAMSEGAILKLGRYPEGD